MTVLVSQCSICVHFYTQKLKDTCQAFPGQIPPEILSNRVDHRKPVKGDHGIQFERDPKAPEGIEHPLK